MAILTPVVTPANGTTGVEIGVSPTAIFSQAIEPGSVTAGSCFLVATQYDSTTSEFIIPPATIQNIVDAEVTSQRWHLTNDEEVSTVDYGAASKGLLYRTKITVNPLKPLDKNTNYALILSKDISTLTVYDPEILAQTGTGILLSKGIYTGIIDDEYTITITNTGVNNSAKYTWTRSSDNFTSSVLDAKERYIEIDQGVKVKFVSGQFAAGDVYRIRVSVANYLNDFFSWGFATANADYEVPNDKNSNSVVNLPATGGGFDGSSVSANPDFYVVSVTPDTAASQVPLGSKAFVIDQGMNFKSLTRDGAWNQYTLQFIEGGTAGSEVIALSGFDITIQIEDGVSTSQQVVDAFNASDLVNTNFAATTATPTSLVDIHVNSLPFRGGRDPIVITITFSKDIDPDSVDFEKIKLVGESLIPGGEVDDLVFTYEVSGAQLIITPTYN